ncbi:mechanosensitive ion channel [Ancylothrix sp. C2]|uniref:mechanosensitive ion channel domain-containing protein n=1 Tax=Ancylothrix sp. D3o TaxID=2953691 RepID=UPI0021BA4B2A|nr:mechanosensitive ion channel domain-containing protein [Ancylothrix sp. D3o]MCT7951059.1 mechanosensitive ion channel [Ancylothrix sp. D3o]
MNPAQILNQASQFFTYRFKIAGAELTISSIFQIILWLTLLILFTRILKKFLKSRLLVKFKIDEGNREALSTIISYAFAVLGFILILQTTGFNLASIAVIAGGLGVGIGFGLQNITNNFVSGLTLLVERTVKVGDFVEFDGLSGYVKEIAIRATIIRTLDGSDVVVPNSKLVENKLVNWSLESYTGRIHIPIGVAYESDPLLVTEILLKSAYMESAVLSDPAPKVIFNGFGDNALHFDLQVWINRIDQKIPVTSSINFIVEYNLRQQGINIPFPQRDLWLRNPEVLNFGRRQREVPQELAEVHHRPIPSPAVKPLALRDLLRQVTYFQNLTDLELRQLIEIGYRKRLLASEILFHEGDPGNAFYIILSGSVEVYVEKINKHLTNLTAGKFFGELALMLGIPRTATVRAKEETILFVITNKGFEKLLRENPELSEVMVQELGKHQEELAQRQQQLREMGLVNAAEDDKNLRVWVRKRLKNLFSL